MNINKNLAIVSFLGMLTIIIGAFGAHGLKEKLTVTEFQSFETAVRYQMYHVIVLLFINTYSNFPKRLQNSLSIIFLIGIIFFSGSIYAMTVFGVPAKSIWFITPLGGLLFVAGWAIMGIQFLVKTKK